MIISYTISVIFFLSLLVLIYRLDKSITSLSKEIVNLKFLVEENKKRNDLLVRVTTSHEHFIEDIKKKAEDFATRTRRNGVR